MATPRIRNRFAGQGDRITNSGVEKWVNIFGDVQVIKNLDRLKSKEQRNVLRKAIGKGLKIIVAVAKRNTPVKKGLLKKAITSSVTKMISGKVYVDPKVFAIKNKFTGGEFKEVKIKGPARGKGWREVEAGFKKADSESQVLKPAKYAHIVEFGSVKRNIKPNPFMRSAMKESRTRVLDMIAEETKKGLEKLLK